MGKVTVTTLILMGVLILFASPCAGGNRAMVTVTAFVRPLLSQSVLYQVGAIQITEEDLRKGYVDVPLGTVLEVRSNDRSGYFLSFEGVADFYREIWVIEGQRTIVLSSNGGLIRQESSPVGPEVKTLAYRIFLKEKIQPGLYPWPLTVRASLF